MEAPLTFITEKETPIEAKSFDIIQEEKSYSLKTEIKEGTILISLVDKANLLGGFEYNKKLSLVEIQKINRFFKGIDTLSEFNEIIENAIVSKDLKIKEEYNLVFILINVIVFNKKEEIKIDLLKERINKEELLENLSVAYSELKNQVKEIKENHTKEINDLKNKLTQNENLVKDLQRKLDKKIFSLLSKSVIVQEVEEIEMLNKAIEERMGKEVKGYNFLYQASTNGDSSEIFHKKCDNKNNTITVIKSKGGRRFGGFVMKNGIIIMVIKMIRKLLFIL